MLFHTPELEAEILKVGVKRHFTQGDVIIHPGDPIIAVPIVLKGSLRIMIEKENQGDYFLYHILPGETCASSLTCCQSNNRSEIKALVEEDATILFIPKPSVDEWMVYDEWKKYIGEAQSQRFSELIETIELMAFGNMFEKLWHYLVRRVQASGSNEIHVTHQAIAAELNSPREVITRLLHQLQKQGKVDIKRGFIVVHLQK